MTIIQDQPQRDRALDPRQSFIVQAPAGSGKTELLTQRFLVLLAHVKQPEEILAITFTKKSAAEMRARIINSLKSACYDPKPESAHAQKTWQLAQNALKQNDALSWNLLDNPNRLRIQTIDSFNVYLTRQLPILSNFGAPPEIADNADALYREAVQEFLSHLEEDVFWADAIAQLLLHMDNNLNNVETLLINLLAKRDQWLPYITLNATDPELRKNLEAQLASVITDILVVISDKFPKKYSNELIALANFAGHNLLRENSDSPIAYCADLTELPGIDADDKDLWIGLANLILTKDFEWRKRFDKTIGFLAPSSTNNKAEKAALQDLQTRIKALVEKLSEYEDLRLSLKELAQAPEPRYQTKQWETLNALHHALRIVVAQLKLTFQKHGQIDYIENALAASAALGDIDAPTDTTLALDYKIHHILIDEFQDTSTSQYRLLEKLIAGWEANDGRTLFIVGDPMQSIYRFREAEVGLFIRSRKIGIGNLALEPLTLSVNFRSVPNIVNWVNEHFQKVLPSFEDISTGAVSYSPSTACKTDASHEPAVVLHPNLKTNRAMQSASIIEIVKNAQEQNPNGSIAILVRSRTHLEDVIPALKQAEIPYRALDIDPLTTRPVIQDLMALTKSLINLADRVSWLAILRAPWCGLTLSDLLLIAGKKSELLIWERLNDSSVIKELSDNGKKCLARILTVLKMKMAERRRHTLRTWVESTWLMLGGPACLDQPNDLDDAIAYFKLLENLDNGGDLSNVQELDNHVSRLFASSNSHNENTLQIMTIHSSKGLEFDTVILPHLERKSSNDDKQLLLWMERSKQSDSSALILAPVHAIGDDNDSIYDYIKRQNSIKADYEYGRLLYVAVTRAKKNLHLLFDIDVDKKNPSNMSKPMTKSLLEKIWGTIHNEINEIVHNQKFNLENPVSENSAEKNKIYKRLSLNWQQPLIEINSASIPAYNQSASGFILPNNTPKHTGTLIHQILQQLCLHGIDWWQSQTEAIKNTYIKKNLLQLGVTSAHLFSATETVATSIKNLLNDERGQWIIYPHKDAKAEFPITSVIDEQAKPLILDRTFIDENGIRWIIDYKTTPYTGDNLEAFLAAEQTKHEAQLQEYSLAMQQLEDRPIRVGLYFPAIPAWSEVVLKDTFIHV